MDIFSATQFVQSFRLYLNVSTFRGFGLLFVRFLGFGLFLCPLLGVHFNGGSHTRGDSPIPGTFSPNRP